MKAAKKVLFLVNNKGNKDQAGLLIFVWVFVNFDNYVPN